jgi:hypothetical protein
MVQSFDKGDGIAEEYINHFMWLTGAGIILFWFRTWLSSIGERDQAEVAADTAGAV